MFRYSEAMSRRAANGFMETFVNGTYMIRESVERKGQYALSIK